MFATLARRWRIVAPLVTALVAVSIVVSAFIVPASAHNKTVHFRYSGDAADFINYGVNPAFFDCFSGYLGPDGSGGTTISDSLDNCTDAGFSTLDLTLAADVAAWDVQASHTKTEGHADATAAIVGDVHVFAENTDNCGGSGDFQHFNCILAADEVRTTAEAECQSHNNHLHSDARSETAVSSLELFGAERANYDFTTYVNAFTNIGLGGGTVQIVRTISGGRFSGETVIFTFNEQLKDVGRSFAAISANGVHIIIQEDNGSGGIEENVVIAHVHADIECSFQNFTFEDPIGA